jgi:hypothetical protein
MTVTTHQLTRAAGLSAVVGGLLFIAVQIKHPLLDAPFTTTTEYALRESAKILMVFLSLAGVTGLYLRQVRQIGVLGLVGYLVLALGYLAILSVQVVGVFVLPVLAVTEPGFVDDVLAVAASRTPSHDIGPLQLLIQGGGFAYVAGGLLFGVALFRAAVLPRWASALLAVGAVAILATAHLPELTQRLFAVPVSVALVGLGWSLWREQRVRVGSTLPGAVSPQLDPTSAG